MPKEVTVEVSPIIRKTIRMSRHEAEWVRRWASSLGISENQYMLDRINTGQAAPQNTGVPDELVHQMARVVTSIEMHVQRREHEGYTFTMRELLELNQINKDLSKLLFRIARR